jgi:tetratricopeptide (TPR) repeat protein
MEHDMNIFNNKLWKWTALACVTVVLLAGCERPPDSKLELTKQWNHTRAQVAYGCALEQFKTGQLDQCSAKVQECLTLEPENIDGHILEGKLLIEQGEYLLASSELEGVLRRSAQPQAQPQQKPIDIGKPVTPPQPLLSAERSAEVVYLLGVAQEKDGKLAQALDSYRRSLAMDPRNVCAISAAGEVLAAMGRPAEALAYVEGYVSRSTIDPGLHELAGKLATMTGDHEKAVAHYQQACNMDGKNLGYRELLGRAQFQAGKYTDAIETLTPLCAGDKDRTASLSVLLILGDCQMQTGKSNGALEAYRHATELFPDDAGAWTALAKASLACHDDAKTALAARQALALDPDRADASALLGYALIRQGEIHKATAQLLASSKEHAEDATIQCLLGQAYAAGGQPERAMQCYATALKLEPDNRLARELLKH